MIIQICVTCKKPIKEGEARYALTRDEKDPTVGEHWSCHVPIEKMFAELRGKIKERK